MADFVCSHCSAPRQVGHVICAYCRQAYDASVVATAITCPQCRVLSTGDQQKCVGCGAWIVVQCVFCGALSPHHTTACSRCQEPFLGAAERKARADAAAAAASEDDADDELDEDGWEEDWAWCSKCEGMVWDSEDGGRCAAGGAHDTSDSEAYYLSVADEEYTGEKGWRWCQNCQALYRGDHAGGVCPAAPKGAASRPHDGSASHEYTISRAHGDDEDDDYDDDAGGWKRCRRCASMFWGEKGGACAAGGKHDRGDETDYSIPYEDD